MKLLRSLLVVALTAMVIPVLPARAQLGVYGTFNAARLNLPVDNSNSDNWAYGGGAGAYLQHGHFVFLSAGLDLRFEDLKGSSSGSGYSTSYNETAGYIGPRLAFRPHILPVQPYVEALVGAAHIQDTNNVQELTPNGILTVNTSPSETKFSYQIVGGLDYTLLPRIDWRVAEVGYGTLKAFGDSVNPISVSTGIVIRLPGIF
jgi:opacity protein-like surface antigen